MNGWRFDPAIWCAAFAAAALYGWGVRAFAARRGRAWPASRTAWFAGGIASAVLAIESPLDAAADVRFTPHMVQHLILTDVTAPALLLGAPLLLALGASRTGVARRIVAVLRSRVVHALTFPPFTWTLFVMTLWAVHDSGFFEAALVSEPLHVVEHALFLGTALLFWLPVIAIGPTPWADGPLAHPLRMLYLLVAMPAEGMLGFTLNGARHVLYPAYAAAGIADQQAAGELMWIGSTLCMFAAFMLAGAGWARHEQRLGDRADARA